MAHLRKQARKAEAEAAAAKAAEDSHDLVEDAMRKLREGIESSPRVSRRERRQKQTTPSSLRNVSTPGATGDPAASALDMLAALKGEGVSHLHEPRLRATDTDVTQFDASTPSPAVTVNVPQSRRQRRDNRPRFDQLPIVSPIVEETSPALEEDTDDNDNKT